MKYQDNHWFGWWWPSWVEPWVRFGKYPGFTTTATNTVHWRVSIGDCNKSSQSTDSFPAWRRGCIRNILFDNQKLAKMPKKLVFSTRISTETIAMVIKHQMSRPEKFKESQLQKFLVVTEHLFDSHIIQTLVPRAGFDGKGLSRWKRLLGRFLVLPRFENRG